MTGSVRRLSCVIALTLAFIAAIVCSSPPESEGETTGNADSPVVSARTGEDIFAETCAVCHGESGEGQPNWHIPKADGTLPPPPLNGDGHTWHHGDGFLYRMVRDGGKWLESPSLPHFKSGMPAFDDQLSHEEIIAVITHVKTLWRDKTGRGMPIREWQSEVSLNDPFPAGR